MNLKLFSCSLILLVSYASFIAAHGHSHDGDHAHSHGHEDVNPSFKYSKQANDQIKQQHNPSGHDCKHHGHSHDEPRTKREVPPEKQEKIPAGY